MIFKSVLGQIPVVQELGYATISDLTLIYENGSTFTSPQLECNITSAWDFYETNYRETKHWGLTTDTLYCNIFIKRCFYPLPIETFDYERYTQTLGELVILNIYSDTNSVNTSFCPNQNYYGLIASDTILASEVVTASLNEISEPQISVYPNPTTSYLNIKVNNNALVESVEITSMGGTTVLTQKETEKIPISHLAAGVYFIHVRYDNAVITKKFVKE
jgi:hypothetical protein